MEIIDKAPLIRGEQVNNIIGCDAVSAQVAGTNGKGSTCAFLSSVLQAHGKKVGLYTSPHIMDICERIRVNGQNIPIGRFEELVKELDAGQKGMCKSDLMFFSAVKYFNEEKVDFAVFETGLGGSRDSATLIGHDYGIITQIGLDHMEYLGNTIEEISREKAGIIKEGMRVYAYPNSTNYIIENVCREKKSTLKKLNKDYFTFENSGFSFSCFGFDMNNICLKMHGNFQGYNCACALLCAKDMLGNEFCAEKAKRAVEETAVPGRMTVLKKSPLVLADVSHNPDGIRELCAYADSLKGRKCAVVSIPKTKDYKEMMKLLMESFDLVIATKADITSRNSNELGGNISAGDPKSAYDVAINAGMDIIIFCGSFAIVREIYDFL